MERRLQSSLMQAMQAANHSCEDWGEEEEEEEEEASEYSQTNTQVADVDEADFVKNDGGYLYILAGGRFQVLDAWPADQAHLRSSFPIAGTPRRMYVHADTAIIYSALDQEWEGAADDGCTYGYDCDFTGDGYKLQITVLDITDRGKPRLVRELVFNGSYLNSRRVGMDVHTVVVSPELEVQDLSYWPKGLPKWHCGLKEAGFPLFKVLDMFVKLHAANVERIEETTVDELLPSVRDIRHEDDLANPGAPSVKGELKIPGYSTYMHLMDDEHLLTMGYDAEEHGDFAYFQGLQLQVIDVSELSNPLLVHKEMIGTRGSTSDAATNHLAFTYFKSRDLLAVPMTICEGGDGGGDYGDLMTFSGLLVYRVTTGDGFTLVGGVPHEEPETEQTWSGKCNNWWTESASKVKRSVFMEDWVFSIARDQVNVAHLNDLDHPAVSIPLL